MVTVLKWNIKLSTFPHTLLLVLNIQIRFKEKTFGPVNLKNLIKTLFTILWYMHINKELIKKNDLN